MQVSNTDDLYVIANLYTSMQELQYHYWNLLIYTNFRFLIVNEY